MSEESGGYEYDDSKPTILSAEERFWRWVDKGGECPPHLPPELGPCWFWMGSIGDTGYGQFRTGGSRAKMAKPHRYSYELHYGPIPEAHIIRHLCNERLCVNPAHLAVGSHANNLDDRLQEIVYKRTGKHCPTCTCGV